MAISQILVLHGNLTKRVRVRMLLFGRNNGLTDSDTTNITWTASEAKLILRNSELRQSKRLRRPQLDYLRAVNSSCFDSGSRL